MTWLDGLLYGLISGFTEFMPISSIAHQSLFMKIFGYNQRNPLLDMLIHIALIAALIVACRTSFEQMIGEYYNRNRRLRNRTASKSVSGDFRLIKAATIPYCACFVLYLITYKYENSLLKLLFFFLINGIILFIPERIAKSNKDARSMSGLDSLLIGFAGALSIFPGISRIGAMNSVAVMRGADRKIAFQWSLILSIVALALLVVFDLIFMIVYGGVSFSLSVFFGYILSVVGAFAGGYCSILIMQFIIVNAGFSGFAYYSWGASLFSFILYLAVV